MYTEYFGLRQRPFEIKPDAQFLYLSDQHDRAIANIRFAIANKDCFVVITGEIGAGKTTILNNVLSSLDRDIELARLTHTSLTPRELLQAVLLAFGQPVRDESKVLLFDRVRLFLEQMYEQGKHVIIAVDEAQNLGSAALEELRLLTCIATESEEQLTVVLMGQPNLVELVNSPELQNLRQRTRLRQHLRRLTLAETISYLEHRIATAGGEFTNVFEPNAVELIHQATLGTPRLINTLCDTAMMAAAVRDAGTVSRECIVEVLDELGWKGRDVAAYGASDSVQPDEQPSLAVFERGEQFTEVSITESLFVIGRDDTNHLALPDRCVSRRHAIIARKKNAFVLEDLGGVNTTCLNRQPCVRHFHILRDGDRITIGYYDLIFRSPVVVRDSLGGEEGERDVTRDSHSSIPDIDLDVLPQPNRASGGQGER